MALKKCKECGHSVSSKAKTCPSCGAPVKRGTSIWSLLGLIVVVGLVASAFGPEGDTSQPQAPSPKDDEKRAMSPEQCVEDLHCWSDANFNHATVDCEMAVEKLAKYSFRWKKEHFQPALTNVKWLDKGKKTLSYLGDNVEFQNGFGAWQRQTYRCDYNPLAREVINVVVQPGRLD